MAQIEIIVGTVTGTAHRVAQCLGARLAQLGHSCEFNLNGAAPNAESVWLICSSNTGCGDLPANIQPFYAYLLNQSAYLGGVRYAQINLGDSCYPSFGAAGTSMEAALQDLGAKPLCAMLTLDAIYTHTPEPAALSWLATWETQL